MKNCISFFCVVICVFVLCGTTSATAQEQRTTSTYYKNLVEDGQIKFIEVQAIEMKKIIREKPLPDGFPQHCADRINNEEREFVCFEQNNNQAQYKFSFLYVQNISAPWHVTTNSTGEVNILTQPQKESLDFFLTLTTFVCVGVYIICLGAYIGGKQQSFTKLLLFCMTILIAVIISSMIVMKFGDIIGVLTVFATAIIIMIILSEKPIFGGWVIFIHFPAGILYSLLVVMISISHNSLMDAGLHKYAVFLCIIFAISAFVYVKARQRAQRKVMENSPV